MNDNEIENKAHNLYNDKKLNELRELSKNENNPVITFMYGKLLEENDETLDEAIEVFESLEGTVRSNVGILHEGRCLVRKGELVKARKTFKKIIKTKLGYLALYEIGKIRELEGNMAGAKGCYFQSLELKKDPYTFYNLGRIYYQEGNYKSAIKFFKRSLRLNKDDYYCRFELARTFIMVKQYNQAEKLLKELKLERKNDYYVDLELGKLKFEQRKYSEAENYFNLVLNVKPNDVYCLRLSGLSCYFEKRYKDAVVYFEKVLDIELNYVSKLFLAKALVRLKKYKLAEKHLKELLDSNYQEGKILYELGNSKLNQQDYSAAKYYLEASLEIEEVDEVLLRASEANRFLGNFSLAEEQLDKCKEKRSEHVVLYQKAMILIRKGNIKEAVPLLEKSVDLNFSDFAVLRALIQVYIKLDEIQKIVSIIEKYPSILNDLSNDILVYIYTKTGRNFGKLDLNNLNYKERQILNYSSQEAINYIIHLREIDYFMDKEYGDLDLCEVFNAVKSKLTEENKVNTLALGNTYLLKLETGMMVEVLTLPNNDIIKISPVYDLCNKFVDGGNWNKIKN